MKPNEAPQMPADFNPPAAGGQAGQAPPQGDIFNDLCSFFIIWGGDKNNARMAYSFDSTALERAAKAAKELEKFPNAKEALELSRLQEVTRQKEVEQQTKVNY